MYNLFDDDLQFVKTFVSDCQLFWNSEVQKHKVKKYVFFFALKVVIYSLDMFKRKLL